MTDPPPGAGAASRVALVLGSNLGDRLEHLRHGLQGLARHLHVVAVSPVYRTAPVGYEDQPHFLNAAVLGTTELGPRDLLVAAHRVEAVAGRRRTFPDAPRVLDIDLILYAGLVVREPGLRVPHPRWKDRSFVLGPLADVAPGLVDPETGRTVQEIWDARRDGLPPLERIEPPEALWRKST